jgi:TetR/AcrR family fatty acid metabolism transcriptional regulator
MGEKSNNDIINLRRSQLTRAAYNVVSKKGYYNFTIRDISKESGLSTGLVHYYFKNKQDLMLNLIREMNKNLKKYLNNGLSRSEDPVEKLKIYITQAFELVKNEENYFYVVIDFFSQINRSERMRKANIRLIESYRDECARILQEGVEKGVFKDIDIKYVTTVIISLIQGMIIQYVIDKNAFDYGEYAQRVIQQIIDMVLK